MPAFTVSQCWHQFESRVMTLEAKVKCHRPPIKVHHKDTSTMNWQMDVSLLNRWKTISQELGVGLHLPLDGTAIINDKPIVAGRNHAPFIFKRQQVDSVSVLHSIILFYIDTNGNIKVMQKTFAFSSCLLLFTSSLHHGHQGLHTQHGEWSRFISSLKTHDITTTAGR
jgi:hypothetical protein